MWVFRTIAEHLLMLTLTVHTVCNINSLKVSFLIPEVHEKVKTANLWKDCAMKAVFIKMM